MSKITNRVDEEYCDWCRKLNHCAQFQVDPGDGGCLIVYLCKACCVAAAVSIQMVEAWE